MLPYLYFQKKKMLFGFPQLLSPEACQNLRNDMAKQPYQNATINKAEGDYLANDIRKTAIVEMPKARYHEITNLLKNRIPQFNQFHNMQLSHCQEILFLRYQKDDFFKAHTDHYRTIPHGRKQRKLSVIIFLNTPPAYQGGELLLYAPASRLQNRQMGLPLKAENGLMVSFLPGITHEVKPIIQGERFTVVAWMV